MSIDAVLPVILQHLEQLSDRLRCFHCHECQVESWLKGELLYVLQSHAESLGIKHVRCEVKAPGGRIDIEITFVDLSLMWIELKHWHIGRQRGVLWRAVDCMGVEGAYGLANDAKKLTSGERAGHGFALILFTANPGKDDFMLGVHAFNRRIAPLCAEPLTDPTAFPDSYFLGVLRIADSSSLPAETLPPVALGVRNVHAPENEHRSATPPP